MSSGFLGLQLAIDLSYIQMVYGNKELPVDLTFQEDPYPPHEDDGGFNEFFMYSLPFVTAFSFMLLCPAVIKRVSEEKFTGIKVSEVFQYYYGVLNVCYSGTDENVWLEVMDVVARLVPTWFPCQLSFSCADCYVNERAVLWCNGSTDNVLQFVSFSGVFDTILCGLYSSLFCDKLVDQQT